MTRATSDHEVYHALAAGQAVAALHGSGALCEFGLVFDTRSDSGAFILSHDDQVKTREPMALCGLGPVVQRLVTPEALAAAIRKPDSAMDALTKAGDLSSADRTLARQVENPALQLRVLCAVQHLVNKRLGGPQGRAFGVLSKCLRDAENQGLHSGELTLADLIMPSAARGADAAGKHAVAKILDGVRA